MLNNGIYRLNRLGRLNRLSRLNRLTKPNACNILVCTIDYREKNKIYNYNKRFFNGPFERPTESLFSHLQILGIIDSIKYFNTSLSWTFSIAITSSLIRLLQIPTYWLIKDINFSKLFPSIFTNFINKWYEKLIINDLHIDMERRKIDNSDKNRLIEFYNPNFIFSWITQGVLLFNNFRALNSISKGSADFSDLFRTLYPKFDNDLFGMNLALYDGNFILPIVIFANNYILLKVVNHPWLINYSKGSAKLIYISFLSSLFWIIVPKCYCISWIAYSLTHVTIRLISDYMYKRKKYLNSYEYYVEKNYKKVVEKLLDKNKSETESKTKDNNKKNRH